MITGVGATRNNPPPKNENSLFWMKWIWEITVTNQKYIHEEIEDRLSSNKKSAEEKTWFIEG
jgi:hypothetical protein